MIIVDSCCGLPEKRGADGYASGNQDVQGVTWVTPGIPQLSPRWLTIDGLFQEVSATVMKCGQEGFSQGVAFGSRGFFK